MLEEEQNTENKILAAHRGEGLGSQGGAQQGTGARGEQYLDGPARSHTIAAGVLFGYSVSSSQQIPAISNKKSSLADCPFFRSKPTLQPKGLQAPTHFPVDRFFCL